MTCYESGQFLGQNIRYIPYHNDSLGEIGEDMYWQWFATKDHEIQRAIYAKLQF